MNWGPGGASSTDTNLYRSAADTLKTDDNFDMNTADTTGHLLTLDTKTNAGDPTGTNGAMYYNSNSDRFRCNQNDVGWQDCLGVPKPNNRRWAGFTTNGSNATLAPQGDIATATGTASQATVQSDRPPQNTLTTTAVSGNQAGYTGNANYGPTKQPLFQSYASTSTTSSVRYWVGLTANTFAAQGASADPGGDYAIFRYDTSAGDANWKCITSDNGTETVNDSGVAASASFVGNKYEIVIASGVATFRINGTEVCSNGSNVPTDMLRYVHSVTTLTASTAAIRTAWIYLETSE